MTGEKIKKIIIQEGYSITDIAKKLGISQQNLSSKLGTDSVKTGILEEICAVMNMKINDFYIDTPYGVKTTETIEGDNATEIIKRLLDKLEQKEKEIENILKEKENLKEENRNLRNQIGDMQCGMTLEEIGKKG